jgi:hypothetical protein
MSLACAGSADSRSRRRSCGGNQAKAAGELAERLPLRVERLALAAVMHLAKADCRHFCDVRHFTVGDLTLTPYHWRLIQWRVTSLMNGTAKKGLPAAATKRYEAPSKLDPSRRRARAKRRRRHHGSVVVPEKAKRHDGHSRQPRPGDGTVGLAHAAHLYGRYRFPPEIDDLRRAGVLLRFDVSRTGRSHP